MTFMKNARILLLVLPLCLVFSFFLTNNTFAEAKDKVCKSLIAKADTYGEWSPAVTVCAGKNADGKVILVSLGLEPNYFSKGANVNGIAKEATIDVDDNPGGGNPERGVIFRGNESGVINVGGLTGSATMGGSFKSLDYDNPETFVSDVLNAGKNKVIQSNELVRKKHIQLSGGVKIADCSDNDYLIAAKQGCNHEFDNGAYDTKIGNMTDYSRSECEMVERTSRPEYGDAGSYNEYTYELICGGTPAHDKTVKYSVYIADEDSTVAEGATATAPVEDPGSAEVEAENTCNNTGGAMSLGWILCPAMQLMGGASEELYKSVEPFLRVDPQFFGEINSGSATEQAWGTFRDMANTIFIIFLLVVIFSQITGVGINNYGIKKILPKLIIAVVMINLSYIICLICIDLSNIIGNGLQALFDGLSEGLTPSLNIEGSNASLDAAAVGATAITAVAVLAAVVIMAGVVWRNPAVVLSILVSALSIVIGIFFLFILLVVRQAAIIVLVVVSPIAVICYMLPNAKSVFDKWLKFFKALLLLYPICGLLVGGGNYVSTLLLTAGFGDQGFINAFAAMVVGIAPIFFIPTVLKTSFNQLGTIGQKLSGLGDKYSGKARDRVQNSSGYKSMQEMGLNRRIRKRAGLDKNGNQTMLGKAKARAATAVSGVPVIGGIGKGYQKQLARNIQQADKGIREQDAAGALLAEKEAAEWDISDMEKAWEAAYVGGDTERLKALTSVAQTKFGSGAANMIGKVMNKSGGKDDNGNPIPDNRLVKNDGNVDKNIEKSLKALNDMQTHDSTFNSYMSSKASDAYDMISRMGRDGGETPHNLDYFSSGMHSGRDATKSTDFATQSSATLERMKGSMSDDILQELAYGNTETMKAFQSDGDKMQVVEGEIARRKQEGRWHPRNSGGGESGAGNGGAPISTGGQTNVGMSSSGGGEGLNVGNGGSAQVDAGGRSIPPGHYQTDSGLIIPHQRR